jgi:Zn-dependent membrane protease YugP
MRKLTLHVWIAMFLCALAVVAQYVTLPVPF